MGDLQDFARQLDEALQEERGQIEAERRERERIEAEQREHENRVRRAARELRNKVILPRVKSVAARIAPTHTITPGIDDNEYRCDCSAVLPRGKVRISVLAAIQPGNEALRVSTEGTFFAEAQGTSQMKEKSLHNAAKVFRPNGAEGTEVAEWIEAELTKCLKACVRALEG